MRRARRKPNVAKLSGFKSAEEIARSLRDMGNVTESSNTNKHPDFKDLTEEQKVRLRAAGYKILED